MIKYFAVLGINLSILYGILMFFIDHKILIKEPGPILRNTLVLVLALYICYNVITIYILKNKTQESGLVYGIGSKTKAAGIAFYQHIQPFKKELTTWSLIAAGLIVLGFISIGIPGAILLGIPEKLKIAKEITGDSAWPSALLMSFLWPLLFPTAVLVKNYVVKTSYAAHSNSAFLAVVIGGIALLITVIHLLVDKPDA